MTADWFLQIAEPPSTRVRLVCFPYAGAGAAAYRSWAEHFPDDVEIKALQLAGRGWRLREPPVGDFARMADEAAEAVSGSLRDETPTVYFGHSMGAWLALEVARRIGAGPAAPRLLVVSARQAPSLGPKLPPMSHLEDEAFVAEMQGRYGGIPEVILRDRDLLELLLPAVKSDVRALESYEHSREAPLPCPIVAVGGRDDDLVDWEDLAAWAEETEGELRQRMFPGGHFYFNDPSCGVFEYLREELRHLRDGRLDIREQSVSSKEGAWG